MTRPTQEAAPHVTAWLLPLGLQAAAASCAMDWLYPLWFPGVPSGAQS